MFLQPDNIYNDFSIVRKENDNYHFGGKKVKIDDIDIVVTDKTNSFCNLYQISRGMESHNPKKEKSCAMEYRDIVHKIGMSEYVHGLPKTKQTRITIQNK